MTSDLSMVDGLAQLSFLIQNTLAKRAAVHDLSLIQTRLLGVLRDREPSMNELARLLDLDKSSITGLVARAEKRGLVSRVQSPADGRAFHVQLTSAGRALVAQVAGQFEDDVQQIAGVLPAADRKALTVLLSRLVMGQSHW